MRAAGGPRELSKLVWQATRVQLATTLARARAGEFAIGVALWAVKGTLVAAGHDADTAVFDGRFLQIN